MNFVKINLTEGGEVWINLNTVTKIRQIENGITTEIYFTDGTIFRVIETPEEILRKVL